MDYIPHGAVAALGGVVAYVFKDHTKRDDERFKEVKETHAALDGKYDSLSKKIDEHYIKITDILLERLPPKGPV
jgi:hypothetical protein